MAALLAQGAPDIEPPDSADDEAALLAAVQSEEEEIADAATSATVSSLRNFGEAIARVEAMLEIAKQNERRPDARVVWLIDWIARNMRDGRKSGGDYVVGAVHTNTIDGV